jgi:hypothetical protein
MLEIVCNVLGALALNTFMNPDIADMYPFARIISLSMYEVSSLLLKYG